MVLALTMLESQMSNLDTRYQAELPSRLNGMKLGQNLSSISCQGGQNFKASQGQESHVRFWVRPELGLGHKSDSILKSLETGGKEVSIPHVLGVVNAKK